MVLEKVR